MEIGRAPADTTTVLSDPFLTSRQLEVLLGISGALSTRSLKDSPPFVNVMNGSVLHSSLQANRLSVQPALGNLPDNMDEGATNAEVVEHARSPSGAPCAWQIRLAYNENSMRPLGKNRFHAYQIEVPLEASTKFRKIKDVFDADVNRLIVGMSPYSQILLSCRLCMVGTKEGTDLVAEPTIIISCGSQKYKRKIKSSILRIRPHYLEDLKMNLIVRYEKSPPTLAAFSDESAESQSKLDHSVLLDNFRAINIQETVGMTYCGTKIMIESNGPGEIRRTYATLGGIIKIGKSWYGVTTAHSLSHGIPSQTGERLSEDSGEVLDSSDSSENDDGFESDEKKLQALPKMFLPRSLPSSPDLAFMRLESVSPGDRMAYSFICQSQSISGTLARDAVNSDWLAFEIPSVCRRPNFYRSAVGASSPSDEIFPLSRVVDVSEMHSGTVQILCGADESRTGHLSVNIVSLHNGPCVLDVQEIFLEEPIPAGSSGSWVARSDLLLGMVVAISNGGYSCFALPIKQVFESIESVFKQEVQLGKSEYLPQTSDPKFVSRTKVLDTCEPCRQWKIECNGDKPMCKFCSHYGIQCSYADGEEDLTKPLTEVPLSDKVQKVTAPLLHINDSPIMTNKGDDDGQEIVDRKGPVLSKMSRESLTKPASPSAVFPKPIMGETAHPTFGKGNNVWYKISGDRSVPMVIVASRRGLSRKRRPKHREWPYTELGMQAGYSYQIKDVQGKMYEKGKWVDEDLLRFDSTSYRIGQTVWYKPTEGQLPLMTIAAKEMDSIGKVTYQLTDKEGNLFERGKRVNGSLLRLDCSSWFTGLHVWYKASEERYLPMTIAAEEMNSNGKIVYQLKDGEGNIFEHGTWVDESFLRADYSLYLGNPIWYVPPKGQQLPMTIAAKKLNSDGKVLYQLKNEEGNIFEHGRWMGESSIRDFSTSGHDRDDSV